MDARKLSDFTIKINNLFGLREQGSELISLVTEVIDCKRSCLFFLSFDDEEYSELICSSDSNETSFVNLKLRMYNPIITSLKKEKKVLTGKDLNTLAEFSQLRENGPWKIDLDEIELMVPMVSRNQLVGVLVLGAKNCGTYSAEDIRLLESVVANIAVGMEKEYLREKLNHLYAEVEKKSRIDALTELLNRRSLDEAMLSEINRHTRYGGVFSLIILDLESLKFINDNYGHLIGDILLRETGVIMKKSIRSADQAFRFGGDEFAILLPNTPLESAYRVAERIRRQIALNEIAGGANVTASLGLSSWPENGDKPDEVIAAADRALYKAKRNGGNQSQNAESLS